VWVHGVLIMAKLAHRAQFRLVYGLLCSNLNYDFFDFYDYYDFSNNS
jgi:hypothetical protein